MRKRTFGRWATRLAGTAVALCAVALALNAFVALASDFTWG